MKIISLILLLGFNDALYAKCQKEYKAYKRATLASPITAPAISSTHMVEGAYSSTGNLIYGATQTDAGIITAGSVNGLAFTYEGQFYLGRMSSNIRLYKSRSQVLKILNQAELGMGEELEEFLEDLSESFEEEVLDFDALLEIINDANEKKVFCPKGKELFTLGNLRHYILNL